MTDVFLDPELKAMQEIIEILETLDEGARERVIDYVFQRLGISIPVNSAQSTSQPVELDGFNRDKFKQLDLEDIRTLKEKKSPASASEMAVLVAYYLSERSPVEERKSFITKGDIEKFFKQAKYRLPKRPTQTLSNASKGGYFESLGSGKWRLTPVGYNLAVHGLPAKRKEENS